MPYKRGYRKKRRPRRRHIRTVRRYGRRRRVQPLSFFGTTGIPDRYTCTLKFTDRFRLDTAATGLPTGKTFRGNSVFDPVWAVGGAQPYYYDQITPLYAHYVVWRATIIIRAISVDMNGNILVVVPTRDSAFGSAITTVMERPRARTALIGQGGKSYYVKNSATSSAMLPKFTERQLALVSGNPSDEWYFHVVTDSVNPGEDSVLDCVATIYYHVTFYERKNQAGS